MKSVLTQGGRKRASLREHGFVTLAAALLFAPPALASSNSAGFPIESAESANSSSVGQQRVRVRVLSDEDTEQLAASLRGSLSASNVQLTFENSPHFALNEVTASDDPTSIQVWIELSSSQASVFIVDGRSEQVLGRQTISRRDGDDLAWEQIALLVETAVESVELSKETAKENPVEPEQAQSSVLPLHPEPPPDVRLVIRPLFGAGQTASELKSSWRAGLEAGAVVETWTLHPSVAVSANYWFPEFSEAGQIDFQTNVWTLGFLFGAQPWRSDTIQTELLTGPQLYLWSLNAGNTTKLHSQILDLTWGIRGRLYLMAKNGLGLFLSAGLDVDLSPQQFFVEVSGSGAQFQILGQSRWRPVIEAGFSFDGLTMGKGTRDEK